MIRMSTLLFLLIFLEGCSAWIEDFYVLDTLTTDESDPNDSDSGPTSDGETDNPVETDGSTESSSSSDSSSSQPEENCGHTFSSPTGQDIEFCKVTDHSFFMGCDESEEDCRNEEKPVHQVSLSEFYIARYEVTNTQWAAFITDRPAWAKDGSLALQNCDTNYLKNWNGNQPSDGLERPVINVCWFSSQAFCKWLGSDFDLPTEAQWETAARGGHDGHMDDYRSYPFSGEVSCAVANYEGCAGRLLDARSAGGTSDWDVVGMAGNAWEWIRDWYRSDYYCDPGGMGPFVWPDCNENHQWTDPMGDSDGTLKVVRGGSWFHTPDFMRNAGRQSLSPSTSSDFSGFRCSR